MAEQKKQKALGSEIRMAAKSIKKYVDNRLVEDTGIDATGVEGMTMLFIYRHNDEMITAKEIMSAFNISKATASETLNSLENKGYIVMTSSPDDKRVKVINLTEKGESVNMMFDKEFESINKAIMKSISPEEETAFRATLNKILVNIGDDR